MYFRTAASSWRHLAGMRPAIGIGGKKGSHFAISDQLPCRNRGWIGCAGISPRSAMPIVRRHKPRVVPQGQRNTHLTSLAGTLQRSGASRESITAALMAENAAKCSPPLDSSEVEAIVASISKYPSPTLSQRGDAAETLVQVLLDRQFAGGKSLIFGTDGQFWHYSGKLWEPVPAKWIDGRILETLRTSPVQTSATSASLLRQARTLLEAKLAMKEDLFAFTAEPPPVINCANGELWIGPDGSVELRSHSPQSYLRHCLDVTYDPDATCPEYDRALDGIFRRLQTRRDCGGIGTSCSATSSNLAAIFR